MKFTLKVIAASVLFFGAQAVFSQQVQMPTPVSQRVSLSASASMQVPQDVLTLSLTTQREGVEAQTVQSQLKSALDAALSLAKREAQSGAIDVHTGRFGLSPRYDRNGKLTGWQGSAELVLRGSDFARLGELAGRLTTLTVANASFGLTPQQRQSAQSQAQSQAIAQFRKQASAIAESFGFKAYSLIEAQVNSDGANGPRPQMMTMSARAVAADAPVPLEAGLSTVSVTVSGTVQLQ